MKQEKHTKIKKDFLCVRNDTFQKQYQNVGGVSINLKEYLKLQATKEEIKLMRLELSSLKKEVRSLAQKLSKRELEFFENK